MQNKKITYIQYTNPAAYPPLQHSSRIFAKAGWKVLFLGTGSRGESNFFEFPPHENISIYRWKYYNPGLLQKLHYLCFCIWSAFTAWWSGSSWVYASDILACPAALLARNLFGLKIIYHEHDSPNPDPKNDSLFIRLLLQCRKYLAKKAEVVVFPNGDRAKLYQKETGRMGSIEIVWNVPALDEWKYFSSPKPSNTVLYYHGSLNKERLPISILEALNILDENIILRFAGYSAGLSYDYGDWYLKEAFKRGLTNRVQYVGSIDRFKLLEECSKGSIGIFFMPKDSADRNMKYMAGASNKPFDYLACGLELIVSNLPDYQELFVMPGHALDCNPLDPKSIVESVLKTIDKINKKKNGKFYKLNKNYDNWNYEMQFAGVFNKVNVKCF